MPALRAYGRLAVGHESDQADGEETDGDNNLPGLEAAPAGVGAAFGTRELICHIFRLLQEIQQPTAEQSQETEPVNHE